MHAMSDGVDDKFLQKVRGVHSGHKHFLASSGRFTVRACVCVCVCVCVRARACVWVC